MISSVYINKLYRSTVPEREPTLPGSLSFVLLGGFWGAGKTSLLQSFSGWLTRRGLRVGMVANDRRDAGRFQRGGKLTQQTVAVVGGCFCSKVDVLINKIISMQESVDVVLAEPAGSCADLVTTIVRPITELHGMTWRRAPYAVLADARFWTERSRTKKKVAAGGGRHQEKEKRRAKAGVGLHFHKNVNYIFMKQLEEADVIVISKVDLLSKTERAMVAEKLNAVFPGKEVRMISTKSGEGLEDLFLYLLMTEYMNVRSVEIDYARYVSGKNMIGCYDADVSIHSVSAPVDGNKLLSSWARALGAVLQKEGMELAHLRLSLENRRDLEGNEMRGLAVAQQAACDEAASLSEILTEKVLVGGVLINIRAEGRGGAIKRLVHGVLDNEKTKEKVRLTWRGEKTFQPSEPAPRHCIARSVL